MPDPLGSTVYQQATTAWTYALALVHAAPRRAQEAGSAPDHAQRNLCGHMVEESARFAREWYERFPE